MAGAASSPNIGKRGCRGSRGNRGGAFSHDPALQRLFNDLVQEEWAAASQQLRGKSLEADFVRRKQVVFHRLCRRVPRTVQRTRQHRGLAKAISRFWVTPRMLRAVQDWRVRMAGDVPLTPFKAFLAQVGKLGLSLSPMGAHNLHRFQSRLDGAGPLLTAAGDHDQGRMGAIPSSAGDRLQMGLAAPSPARAPTQMGLAVSPPPRVSTQVGVAALPSARGSMQMGISTPSPAQVSMQIVWAATSLYQDVLPAQRVAGKEIARDPVRAWGSSALG